MEFSILFLLPPKHMVVAPSNVGPRTRSWRNEIWGEDSNRTTSSTHEDKHETQKVEVWKMTFLFNWVIFGFHVNFPGCMFRYVHMPIYQHSDTIDLHKYKKWLLFNYLCTCTPSGNTHLCRKASHSTPRLHRYFGHMVRPTSKAPGGWMRFGAGIGYLQLAVVPLPRIPVTTKDYHFW